VCVAVFLATTEIACALLLGLWHTTTLVRDQPSFLDDWFGPPRATQRRKL